MDYIEDYQMCEVIPISTLPCTECCAQCPTPSAKRPWSKQEEKANNMNYACDNLETQQRNHLRRRIDDTVYTLRAALREQFNMDVDARPTTQAEIERKLKAGEFTLDPNAFDKDGKVLSFFSTRGSIIWVDPTKPRDEKGYRTARAAMDKAVQAAKDIALISPLADGLKALTDLEGWTFTAA